MDVTDCSGCGWWVGNAVGWLVGCCCWSAAGGLDGIKCGAGTVASAMRCRWRMGEWADGGGGA